MRLRFSSLLVLCLLAASMGFAQGTTSRVLGVVSDSSGAVIPNAKVTLTNQATNVSFDTTTTGAGTYVFEAVQVGRYTLAVEAAGFRKFVSADNRVEIGQPTTINPTLEVGAVAETVSVSGTAELVQTSSSGNFGSIIEQRVIQDLPIVGTRGRNPLTLVMSQPGVVAGGNTGGLVHVNGARDRAWNYTLDGIDINETSAGGSNFAPLRTNPDSLAEFKIITSNPTAEFGRNSGGQVTMITRSGSNEFNGSLFWFYRTPRFNANEWQNNYNRVGKRQFVQHIPGFAVGGPIIKNRTFFFVNQQWLRTRETGTFSPLTYTADARRGNWRYVIGGRNTPAGTAGASVDPAGNVLPGLSIATYNIVQNDPERLGFDPTTQALIGKMPLPNNFTLGDGLNRAAYTFTALQREKQADTTIKIDHMLSPRHSLMGRYAWGGQDTLCDQVNGGQPPFPGLSCLVNTTRDPRNLALSWRWTPTGRVTNELVVGGNHFTFNFITPEANPDMFSFSFDDVRIPEDHLLGNLRTINTYQIVENLSYTRGAHALKFGANLRYQQHRDIRGSVAGQNVHPLVNFSTTRNTVDPTRFALPGNINQAFDRPALERSINFMLGRVGDITQAFVAEGDRYAAGGTPYNFDARFPEYDFYFQDNWKLRRNLTVDFGLRWELKLNPRAPSNVILAPNQLVTVGAAPSSTLRWVERDLFENDINNWGPSIGLAWSPFGSGKTAVRANYRLAYDRLNTFVLSSSVFQNLPGQTQGIVLTDFGQGGGRLRNAPRPAAPAGSPSALTQPASTPTGNITVVDPDFRSPKTNMWGLSIQQELPWRILFDASYIGRRGVGLYGAYDINQAIIRQNGFLDAFNIVKAGGESALMNQLMGPDSRRGANQSGSALVRSLYASDLNLNNVAGLAKTIATRIQGGRTLPELAGLGSFFFLPFPQYSIVRVIDSNDWSTYNALELRAEKRFEQSLGFMLGYTWAKSLDTRSFDPAFTTVSTGNAQSAGSTPFDIYNRRLNYARSDFDRTHVFKASGIWELPFGRGHRFASSVHPVVNAVIGGWEVAGFMTLQTGRPFTIYSGSNTFSNVVQTPANCSGCSRSDGRVHLDVPQGQMFYLDPTERARFTAPAAGEFGNTGRNSLDGPGSFSMDLGILKRFHITENHRIEYRAEFTNLTNTPTFDIPTATLTSTLFGRIGGGVASGSRKIQMALKYHF